MASTPTIRLLGEQIADNADIILNGGRLDFLGAETAGVLRMRGAGSLDFVSGASIASFSAFDNADNYPLSIENWNGELTGGGTDQLRVKGLDFARLGTLRFAGYPDGARALDFGSYFELVPIPEPSSIALMAIGLLMTSGNLRRAKRYCAPTRAVESFASTKE